MGLAVMVEVALPGNSLPFGRPRSTPDSENPFRALVVAHSMLGGFGFCLRDSELGFCRMNGCQRLSTPLPPHGIQKKEPMC